MRWFRGSEAIMFKASMLYYRFKNIYLIGEPEDTLSPEYIHSLQEETERQEEQYTPQTIAGMCNTPTHTAYYLLNYIHI